MESGRRMNLDELRYALENLNRLDDLSERYGSMTMEEFLSQPVRLDRYGIRCIKDLDGYSYGTVFKTNNGRRYSSAHLYKDIKGALWHLRPLSIDLSDLTSWSRHYSTVDDCIAEVRESVKKRIEDNDAQNRDLQEALVSNGYDGEAHFAETIATRYILLSSGLVVTVMKDSWELYLPTIIQYIAHRDNNIDMADIALPRDGK